MERSGKSNIQWIIHVLIKGTPLKSKDIAVATSEASGKNIKVQDVASMLSRVSDPKKCDLGFFFKKIQDGKSYFYTFVEEAMDLSEEQLYGLYLKNGSERYPIEKAVEDYPELRKYVPEDIIENAIAGTRRKRRKKRTTTTQSARGAASRRSSGGSSRQSAVIARNVVNTIEGKVAQAIDSMPIANGADPNNLNININIAVRFEGFGR